MPANFQELDGLIREHTPEGKGKKQILQVLHEIDEVGACVLRYYERMPKCSRLKKLEEMQPCLALT